MEALEQADPINNQTGEHESRVIDAQRDLLSNSAGLPNVAAPPESHEAVSSVEPTQPEPEQTDWP
jgi:hypothetical protein